ncbi:MAG TPA: multicopper oxidase [Methanomicrobiales archaeon]|nr:multicopper oxidase [Methanomicrobiales archaeon]
MTQSAQQMLPKPFPATVMWGYGGRAIDPLDGKSNVRFISSAPGPTFEATRGTPVKVKWQNGIGHAIFPVDPTLHWADPNNKGMLNCSDIDCTQQYPPGYTFAQRPVALATHLHGGEDQSTSDGNPDAWWTVNGQHGKYYSTNETTTPNAAVYYYPNKQPPTTLWYHDHALGVTRLNVLSGLAGFYLLRDPNDDAEIALEKAGLVKTKYEIPLVLQDRSFNKDGSLWFPKNGNSPFDHPYWQPEFFGDVIMANGKVWPKMSVDRGVYRFRTLDGSNARFYTLKFCTNETNSSDLCNPADVPMHQIGSDGGYLPAPAPLDELTIAPGERADILVDFSRLKAGDVVYLRNFANTPFPNGTPVDEQSSAVMKFVGTGDPGPKYPDLPNPLNDIPDLGPPDNTRILVLKEIVNMTNNQPIMITLNGQRWMADISEKPELGTTEDWVIVNPTPDAHPIHLHLVQFQLQGRQAMNTDAYVQDWQELNRNNLMDMGYSEEEVAMMPPWPNNYTVEELAPFSGDYHVQPSEPIPANEAGWKDTIQMLPGQVTTIRVRFSPIDGSANYSFNATEGPGYVWHCHILDHEDNEMMRPYIVT